MKIQKEKFYTILFVLVIFSQLYVSSFRFNTFLQLAVLFFYLLFERIVFSKSFLNQLKPMLYIFFLGFIGILFNKYGLVSILKDIFHIIKPILGCLIGYFFFKKINNFKQFVKIIVLCGFVSAVIHFLVLFTISDLFSGSVSSIREYGRDNFLELFALIFLIFYKKYQGERLFDSQSKHRLIAGILAASNFLYLSRTMIGVFVILLLSVYGYTVITKKGLRIIGMLFLSVILLYVYLYSVKVQRAKEGFEAFLYKVKMAPAEIFVTKIDREDHKDLWDHWRGYEAKRAIALMNENPESYLIGCGYGSLVNLKFFAPLTDNYNDKGMKYISELHNGYIYLLYKVGFLGLLIYLALLLNWYKIIYLEKNFFTIFISAIGLVYLFTTLTITGIYNSRDIIIFILGALFYFRSASQTKPPVVSV
ncbi:O-antigen ligase family protein [Flavobacterium mekongense]|uniref:O-antigen ligase family protein n=1 Tax=Flavobacterium mekongense TaxID=3379707 RepID=UPI00399BA7D7